MDFKDTPEEAAFRKEAFDWLSANAQLKDLNSARHGMALEEETEENRGDISEAQAWQAKKADAGWACITWPKEYGGRDATTMQSVIWAQEEAKFEVPGNPFMIGLGMAGPMLMVHGSDKQKKRYIPPMLRGEECWCQMFSEPGAGSDLAGVRTRAEQDGGEWILNGQKIWTSGAHYSKFGILLARSNPNVAKHKGLSFFICPTDLPGIELRPIEQITRARNFNEVFFTDARLPDEYRIDEIGNGWKVALTVLMNERASISQNAVAGGISAEELINLAKGSYANGRPAIDDAGVRQNIAAFITRLKAMEFSSARILTALSKGRVPGPEGSLGKLANANLNQEIATFASELQGGMSSILDSEAPLDGIWQKQFLGSPSGRIAGGTDEIQRNIIGERVLGLPGEPRLDKDKAFNEIPTGGR